MTQRTAPWENWHLERGVELLRIFGLVRWGLGGSGHVEVSTFSTSSSSTQDNLLPSPSGILPTIQSESLLQIPIPTTTTTTSPGNNLNTLVSPLETETRSRTPPAKLNSVSTENLPESVPNESNSEHSTAAEAQQIVKRKSRNRRKRPKIQKPDIEIKRVPHRSRNATPTEIITDDEDMITYDVVEGKLEQDPPNQFTIDDDPFILPKGKQNTENSIAGFNCSTVSWEEFVVVDVNNAPIRTNKENLEFLQSSKNIIDADSDDVNEMNPAAAVPLSSEMKNIMKRRRKAPLAGIPSNFYLEPPFEPTSKNLEKSCYVESENSDIMSDVEIIAAVLVNEGMSKNDEDVNIVDTVQTPIT
ncbi:hypothetical protein TNCV_4616241 [Trichonephila clavipes]|nr:hypothetical protein TNCV_4616241 [Trichonephila clavipes]